MPLWQVTAGGRRRVPQVLLRAGSIHIPRAILASPFTTFPPDDRLPSPRRHVVWCALTRFGCPLFVSELLRPRAPPKRTFQRSVIKLV